MNRRFMVSVAAKVRGTYGGTKVEAHQELQRVLNELLEAGHEIMFITVNTVNEYTVVSMPLPDHLRTRRQLREEG